MKVRRWVGMWGKGKEKLIVYSVSCVSEGRTPVEEHHLSCKNAVLFLKMHARTVVEGNMAELVGESQSMQN